MPSPLKKSQNGDAVLAEKIRQGDSHAFEQLYHRYHRQLFWMSKKYVKDLELAEDAVQDVFVKLWTKRATIDDSRSIKSFLFTMLKNHLLNLIRDRKKRIISVYVFKERDLPHQNRTEDDIAYTEYHDIVRQGLDELPDGRRKVFEMKVSGLSNAEIAEMLLVSVHTVKTQYYHGSKFIRRYLKNHADINMVILVVILS